RYVIDVAAGTAAPAARPSQAVAAKDPAPTIGDVVDRPLSLKKVVVIDAGHGGHDPGAQNGDAEEKDITLAAARTLKARLERTGRYQVVMTRDADVYVPLETRVQIARKAGADLFISLHADSAGENADAHGASVYTLSDRGGERVGRVISRNDWFVRTGARASDPAVGQILLDLTQRSTRNRSAVFAGLVVDRISQQVDLLPRSHRDAGYFVLLAPDVPAALLEMGFITNPDDQARLKDPDQRGRLMDAVADAIDSYFTTSTRIAAR
ncbi:MAG TPA: N-acetylmuramoyl-L-alanine amidase, partial [Caulobacteraceae bacterium]|nr:N-acetylmuramoyl-L-alanine amidase [Caulobacteraceae bacterium]